jgi:uncharacterized membrane protein YfcA
VTLLIAVFGLIALAGVVSGFLGAGGQIVGIPLLLYALPALTGRTLDPHTVTSISLAQGLGTLAGGLRAYQRRGLVDWRWVREEALPLAGGGTAGAVLSAALPGRALLLVFAIVTSGATLVLLLPPREGGGPPGLAARGAALTMLVSTGVLGGVVGIGAGFLIIPVLIYVLGLPVRTAGGTGLALAVFLSLPALAGKAATGQVVWDLAAAGAAGSLVGAMVGSRLSGLVGPTLLRRLLAAVVAVLAARVWLDLLIR